MTSDPGAIRRVGVLTTGRHDWGYLEPVCRAIHAHRQLAVTVFCTGIHLHPAFGGTAEAIHASPFETVDAPLYPADAPADNAEIRPDYLAAMSARLVEAMRAHPVEIMVVLGDRIETLAAAVMVVAAGRFLAHIHGGDRAPGEFDDGNRHAITKLAHVHFPATASSAQRIARMGEAADRICQVGSPGIDSIVAEGMAPRSVAAAEAGIDIDEPFALVLQHPCGQGEIAEARDMGEILYGVEMAELKAVILGPNPDPGSEAIRRTARKFSCEHNWPIVPNVGRRAFLRLMHDAVALVGNSSSGMVESAAVNAVAIDVGERQSGREHSANVIHVAPRRQPIAEALAQLTTDTTLRSVLRGAACVFGDGLAAGRIADALARMDMSNQRRIKRNEY